MMTLPRLHPRRRRGRLTGFPRESMPERVWKAPVLCFRIWARKDRGCRVRNFLGENRLLRVVGWVVGLASLSLVACSSATSTESTATTRQAVQSPSAQRQIQLSMTLPSGAALNQVAVGATQSVSLADRDQVPGTIFSDLGNTDVGNDAKVGSLFVNGTTTLHDRSVVAGSILTKAIAKS